MASWLLRTNSSQQNVEHSYGWNPSGCFPPSSGFLFELSFWRWWILTLCSLCRAWLEAETMGHVPPPVLRCSKAAAHRQNNNWPQTLGRVLGSMGSRSGFGRQPCSGSCGGGALGTVWACWDSPEHPHPDLRQLVSPVLCLRKVSPAIESENWRCEVQIDAYLLLICAQRLWSSQRASTSFSHAVVYQIRLIHNLSSSD